MKHMPEKGKTAIKKGEIGLGKLGAGNQTRKAKWCKMQVSFSIIDKMEGVKSQKQ